MSHSENSDELILSSALCLHTAAEKVVIISPFLLSNKNILEHVFTCHYVFIHSKLIIKKPSNSLHSSLYFQFSHYGFLE